VGRKREGVCKPHAPEGGVEEGRAVGKKEVFRNLKRGLGRQQKKKGGGGDHLGKGFLPNKKEGKQAKGGFVGTEGPHNTNQGKVKKGGGVQL